MVALDYIHVPHSYIVSCYSTGTRVNIDSGTTYQYYRTDNTVTPTITTSPTLDVDVIVIRWAEYVTVAKNIDESEKAPAIPKNWRWYDVFRVWEDPKKLLLRVTANSRILRKQERVSISQRRHQKRRMFIQNLVRA